MTVSQLRKRLNGLPKDAVVVLAVEVVIGDDDHRTVEYAPVNVTLRPDLKVQIGDKHN